MARRIDWTGVFVPAVNAGFRPPILDVTRGDFAPLIRRYENWDDDHRDRFATVGDVLVWRLPTFMVADGRLPLLGVEVVGGDDVDHVHVGAPQHLL